jgi:hypothetical protein
MVFDIIRRTIAVVILNVSGAFVGGSVIGIEIWQAGVMAAVAGVMGVAQELSRAYLADGKIDIDEINKTFGRIAEKSGPRED